ncbi:hypothetical protein Tsubulata_032183 [Turnera subulata]|uniref:Uncharacterized protein n=1 Tax=Turnera subulata TaxID=218843 RepID=A0A9Q0J1Q0_9ROSI|nr:hypothetical protein Tsubulata_032183 [Turnera subulata]
MAARKAAALLEQANAMFLRWKMKLRDFISNNPASVPRTVSFATPQHPLALLRQKLEALAPPLPAVHHPPPSSVLVGDTNRGLPSDEVTYSRSSQSTRTTTGTSSDRPRHLLQLESTHWSSSSGATFVSQVKTVALLSFYSSKGNTYYQDCGAGFFRTSIGKNTRKIVCMSLEPKAGT